MAWTQNQSESSVIGFPIALEREDVFADCRSGIEEKNWMTECEMTQATPGKGATYLTEDPTRYFAQNGSLSARERLKK